MSRLFSLAKSGFGGILTQLGFATPLRKILPINKVYEDKQVLAFWHPKPFWEKHIVIVPKKKISVLAEASGEDFLVMGHICAVAAKLVKDLEFDDGYRLITNGGQYQKVKYLHFHLAAGKQIGSDLTD